MVDWMLDALDMYKNQHEDKDVSFMHCYNKLQGCKKWNDLLHTLMKDGEDGPVDPAGASTGWPIGNKKAKAERNAVPILAAMDASIEKMITHSRWRTRKRRIGPSSCRRQSLASKT
ncbi:hypothetical protein QYE76_004746 [Lolium multiflorum]|uniref:Uncharacterized protein n=1 Tax=Lolium multiflorum TaxID=4521 RepID=A0AAD8RV82_LOLMU|nr:hypothetical protein QYE76_004746 [Lolium multiflorum]